MSKGRWVTPDAIPGALKCFALYIPEGLECEASFRGALLMLCDPRNWEHVGEQTPEVMAGAFTEGLYATINNWGDCQMVNREVGEVFLLAHASVPPGALLCDGAEYEQTAYPALFDAIGDTFGGASSGYFRVPNLAARVPIGTGQISGGTLRELGDVGGSETKTISVSNMPAHTHSVAMTSQNINVSIGTPTSVMRPTGSGSTGETGLGTPINTMPPFIALTFAIQAT